MREILFRGKRLYNGEWIKGYYAAAPYTKNTYNYGYIFENEKDLFAKKVWLVDSRTVGQYTSLTDKNGRKIFEGDILKIHYTTELFGETLSTQYNALVMFEDGCNVTKGIFDGAELVDVLSAFSNDEVEVIGNIHDNPELLEVKE